MKIRPHTPTLPLILLICLMAALTAVSAKALHPGASIYKWNKAAPMPGLASRNFTLRGTVATVREGGEMIMAGRRAVLDAPGTTGVHIEIDPRTGFTAYAGLVFKTPCVLSILNDGTLVVVVEGPMGVSAYDAQGKFWHSGGHVINGRKVKAFSDDFADSIRKQRSSDTNDKDLLGYTPGGDAVWIRNDFQTGIYRTSGMASTGGSSAQGALRTVGKNCGRCGKPVSLSAQVGQHCPHCGAYWGAQNSSIIDRPPDLGSPKPGMQSCFIATAAYGSAWEPQVMSLRQFRDQWLLPHAPGRWFVREYYQHSPPLAAMIAEQPWLRAATRMALSPFVLLARASQGSTLDIALLLSVAWVAVNGARRLRHRWMRRAARPI